MTDSILDSVKAAIGLPIEDDSFDSDLVLFINSALSIATQLGVGPKTGYFIEDDRDEWVDFMGDDPRLNCVKQMVYLEVRRVFDPPQAGFALTSIKEQIEEFKWRATFAMDEINIEKAAAAAEEGL